MRLPLYVCVPCLHVWSCHTHTHRCCHPHLQGQHQVVCVSDVHISLVVTFSNALSLFFFLSLPRSHTHTHTGYRRRCCHPPWVQASSAWYLANSFRGPGVRLLDHNVMCLLISAYVVQFEKGEAIPIPVITQTPGYCTLLFIGLILTYIVGS